MPVQLAYIDEICCTGHSSQDHQTVSTIEKAERLKKELTDKWVVVVANAPELKRFASLTGKVKTVNMNCRALVEFDGPVDIGWYDIDASYLTVVDAPKPKKAAGHDAKPAGKAAPAEAKSAAKPTAGGGSPLDKIRAAAKPTAAAPAAGGGSPLDKVRAAAGKPAAPAAAGGSPLDKIRASAKPAAAAPAGGSPLDKIRASAAKPAAAAEPVAKETSAVEATPQPEAPKPEAPKPVVPTGGSVIDRIRAMGAAKQD